MVHYVGLDVSLKQTSICVVSETGSIVRECVTDSDPETIAAFVRSKAPDVVRVGLETGPTSTWLWTELKRLGLPVICIDARHAKAVLKMQINKSDRNDAAGIARIMQTGWFKEVRVKDLDSHALKALLTSRALLVKIKRDLENQVRGLLKNLGYVIGRAKFNVFTARAEELIVGRSELVVAAVKGSLLVSLGYYLEEQIGLVAAKRQVSDLINDKEFWHRDSAVHGFAETALALRRLQHERQIGRAYEPHLPGSLGGEIAERDGQMGLAGP